MCFTIRDFNGKFSKEQKKRMRAKYMTETTKSTEEPVTDVTAEPATASAVDPVVEEEPNAMDGYDDADEREADTSEVLEAEVEMAIKSAWE